MRSLILVVSWLLLPISGYGQAATCSTRDSGKPGVYLEEVKDHDKFFSSHKLKVVNNSCWVIEVALEEPFVPKETIEILLTDGKRIGAARGQLDAIPTYYVVREERLATGTQSTSRPNPERGTFDVAGSAVMAPGASLVFHVPRKYFDGFTAVYVRFKYEWERRIEGDPDHRVWWPARLN